MFFYEILQEIMNEKKLSIPDVARLSGLTDSTVRSIISRKNKSVALEVAFKLSKGLDVSIERLNGDSTESICHKPKNTSSEYTLAEKNHIQKYRKLDTYGRDIIDSVLDLELGRLEDFRRQLEQQEAVSPDPLPIRTEKIPLFDLPVSAGRGEILADDMTFETIEIAEDSIPFGTSYAVTVTGDSMEPDYHDGDILLIENTPSVDLGELGIFILNGEGYFKEFGGDYLVSYNERYSDIPISVDDSFYTRGKVLGVLPQ